MKVSEANDMRRNYQLSLCEALNLDPAKNVDITVNREHYRVEVQGDEIDLSVHRGWYHLVMGEYPTLGLTPGNQITYEQWDKVLEIDDAWRDGFPALEGA